MKRIKGNTYCQKRCWKEPRMPRNWYNTTTATGRRLPEMSICKHPSPSRQSSTARQWSWPRWIATRTTRSNTLQESLPKSYRMWGTVYEVIQEFQGKEKILYLPSFSFPPWFCHVFRESAGSPLDLKDIQIERRKETGRILKYRSKMCLFPGHQLQSTNRHKMQYIHRRGPMCTTTTTHWTL